VFAKVPVLPTLRPCRRQTNPGTADIPAAPATVAAAVNDDDSDTDGRPASRSNVHARTPACRGSKLPMSPMTGKPSVGLSGLLRVSAPSLTSTLEITIVDAGEHPVSGKKRI
jgi:hypothetical protein